MKVFAVLLLAVCACSAAVLDPVVKVDRKGGNFAYSVDGVVPHGYVAPTQYVAHTPYVAGVASVVGKPVVPVTYTATHPVGVYPVPVGGYYGSPVVGYPYGVPVVAKPEKYE